MSVGTFSPPHAARLSIMLRASSRARNFLIFIVCFSSLSFCNFLCGFTGGLVVLFEDATFHDAVILSIKSRKTFVKEELEVPNTFIYLHK
jgi:hypothetical protein